jgi:hypothetical protein
MVAWGVPNAKKGEIAWISPNPVRWRAVNFANGSQNAPKFGPAPI